MQRDLRLFIAVVIGYLLTVAPAYFWISDRFAVLRTLYPASALLAASTLSCSPHASNWLTPAAKYSLWQTWSPAGQLAHVTPHGELQECHYGWSGMPLKSARIDANTRFRYASMTKLLTADLVLRQVRSDQLALGDSIVKALGLPHDMVDERLPNIRVDQLLRHSAGLDRLESTDSMVVRNKKPWCPYDLTPLRDVRLDFSPGEKYAYHNLNYCLLGVILEQTDLRERDFRALMEQTYGLSTRDIRFVDGPYFEDEVTYDFRNSGFYGPDYWKYFDFHALSSSMGLSGSAVAFATLLASLKDKNGELAVTQAPVEPICDETVKRGCYGYAAFRYRPEGAALLVHVQAGFIYGAPSLAIVDEHGGVTVWVGNGSPPAGSATDLMLDHLYGLLEGHYAALAP